jgi:hypothetical protein
MSDPPLKSPYPYFGAKRKIADLVWSRFHTSGIVIEPFFGSGAVYLANPNWRNCEEIINDRDGQITNVWRSIKYNSDKVAELIRDQPIDEIELTTRHVWLIERGKALPELLRSGVDTFDVEAAAFWLWGMSMWIGDGFCDPDRNPGKTRIPSAGRKGVHGHDVRDRLPDVFARLRDRLKHTSIMQGDWERVVSDAFVPKANKVSIFLDPPYAVGASYYAGGEEGDLLKRVSAFCLKHTDSKNVRIALCGYEGTMEIPPGWKAVPWTAQGGYAKDDSEGGEGSKNRFKERIWFSPSCPDPNTVDFQF